MENKNTNQNSNSFENLKKLTSIINGSEINELAINIKKSKSALDTYCKALKEKSAKFEKQTVETPVAKINTTPIQDANIAPDASLLSSTTQTVQSSSSYVSNKSNYQNNGNNNYVPRGNYQNSSYVPRNNYQNNTTNQNGGTYQPRNNYQNNDRNGNTYQRTEGGGYSKPPYQRTDGGGYKGNNFNPNYNRNNANGSTGTPYNGPRQNFGANRPNQPGGYRPGFGANRPQTGVGAPRPMGAKPAFSGLEPLQVKPERNLNKVKSKSVDKETKGLNIKAKIRMGFIELNQDDLMDENDTRMGRVRGKNKKAKEVRIPEKMVIENATITTDNLTVKILSEKIGKPVSEIVKKFMLLGMMININSVIDFDTAELVANEFGIKLERNVGKTAEEQLLEEYAKNIENGKDSKKRPPIVTVMGHVDHGKTSLLDTIKKTNVISSEAGGITQHIGAYSITVNNNKITFIDTPGHEAFTSMRRRGAEVTDIAILVVAADDGIMPQTVEAIKHIKEAKVPMIVAINKIDKPDANIERIKQQLTEHDVLPEEWGGDVICVPISAKMGSNIDKLLEMVLLVADMQELKANPKNPATGTVLESKIDKGRGIVATILIKDGTLKVGDYLLCGTSSGRVRSMIDYLGKTVKSAEPSMAVSVVGLNAVPDAGEIAYVVDEKVAKNIITERTTKQKIEKTKQTNGVTQESFLNTSASQEMKTLKLIIKADVQGSAEALKESLEKICNEEAKVEVISYAVGGINESDVLMAKASDAFIIAFNTKTETKAKTLAARNNVQILNYKVIYDAVEEISKRIQKMLSPKFSENVVGHAEIRHIFKISNVGSVAGCYVLDGTITRNAPIKLKRNGEVIFETNIETLQQNKDEAKQVRSGFECGIKLKGFNDIKEGDIIEAYEKVQIL